MPYKRKYKKSKDKKQDKSINRLVKRVNTLWQPNQEFSIVDWTNIPYKYVGKTNDQQVDRLGVAVTLTSLIQAIGPQGRAKGRVNYTSLRGTLSLKIPVLATYAASGNNSIRVQIIHVKQLEGLQGAHTLPLIQNVYETQATLTSPDIDCFLSAEQGLLKKNRNVTVIFDKRMMLTADAPHFLEQGSINAKNGVQIINPKWMGSSSEFLIRYHIKPPKGMETTYDDVNNNIASCNGNHYILVVWCEENTIVNNIPQYKVALRSTYITTP